MKSYVPPYLPFFPQGINFIPLLKSYLFIYLFIVLWEINLWQLFRTISYAIIHLVFFWLKLDTVFQGVKLEIHYFVSYINQKITTKVDLFNICKTAIGEDEKFWALEWIVILLHETCAKFAKHVCKIYSFQIKTATTISLNFVQLLSIGTLKHLELINVCLALWLNFVVGDCCK